MSARVWGHASVSGRWLRAVRLICLACLTAMPDNESLLPNGCVAGSALRAASRQLASWASAFGGSAQTELPSTHSRAASATELGI